MLYRMRIYQAVPENLPVFHEFFRRWLLPLQQPTSRGASASARTRAKTLISRALARAKALSSRVAMAF